MGVYDNNFLQDYSGITSAGAAVKGFIQGMNDMDDRKMKQQEFQAKMKAMDTQAQRDALNQKLEMRKAGVVQADSGELQQAPITPEERQNQALKASSAGQIATGYDENGFATGYKMDPEQLKAKKMEEDAALRRAMIVASQSNKERTAADREERMDQQIHQRTLNAINSNPQLKQKLNQFQGLDNALSSIVQADNVTPQQVMEFQQAVRGNMGLKGAGGVGEREETYFKTLGMNAANLKQFLTGDPAELAKDSALMQHFKQLAAVEQGNLGKQYEKALRAASSGHGDLYKRRPDLLDELKDKISAEKDMMQTQNPPDQSSNGLIQQPQGFLGKLGGLIWGSPARASAPTPAPHPQDSQAVQWARQNMNSADPKTKQKAATILQMNGG